MLPDMEEAANPADRIWALFESVVGRVTRGQTVSLRMMSHSDADVARRIEERDAQRLSFLTSELVEIGFVLPGRINCRQRQRRRSPTPCHGRWCASRYHCSQLQRAAMEAPEP